MVRPVDLQDNLSKTKILEQVQQLQKSVPEEAQKQFAQELSKKVSQDLRAVPNPPQADKIIIHREKNEKKNNQKRDPKKDKKNQNNDPAQPSSKIDFVA